MKKISSLFTGTTAITGTFGTTTPTSTMPFIRLKEFCENGFDFDQPLPNIRGLKKRFEALCRRLEHFEQQMEKRLEKLRL